MHDHPPSTGGQLLRWSWPVFIAFACASGLSFVRSVSRFPTFTMRDASGLTFWNVDREMAEQAYLWAHLQASDTVLGLGGNVGTNCVFVDHMVLDPTASTCVEPVPAVAAKLRANKEQSGAGFEVLEGFLSRTRTEDVWIVQTGLAARMVPEGTPGAIRAATKNAKLDRYSAAVIDCEGCYCSVADEFPELFEYRLMVVELDAPDKGCTRRFQEQLFEHGFKRIDGSLPGSGTPRMGVFVNRRELGFVDAHLAWQLAHGVQLCATIRKSTGGWLPLWFIAAVLVFSMLAVLIGVCPRCQRSVLKLSLKGQMTLLLFGALVSLSLQLHPMMASDGVLL
eukprot:TRINITY_DN39506_c0_g1_i1.p1 TRINITY_DN39506_c0_g1~~TRINITY_DN39506_c0_g1_i1.p1  ORF type:complete len:337 (-),score=21.52 TRINITY_DN39506_c0_g1_i1:188-1198(-)